MSGEKKSEVKPLLNSKSTSDADALRLRVSRGMALRGVVGDELEAEVLRVLPADFLRYYELVMLAGYGRSVGGTGGPSSSPVEVANGRAVTRVSTGQTETRGPAKPGKNAGKLERSQKDVLDNEAAIRYRQKVNRKLRAIAREMRAWLDGGAGVGDTGVRRSRGRRCSSCGSYAEGTWLYCPMDGRPTEEVS